MESVLGATPHEFESRILRTRPQGQPKAPTALRPGPSSFRGRSPGRGAVGGPPAETVDGHYRHRPPAQRHLARRTPRRRGHRPTHRTASAPSGRALSASSIARSAASPSATESLPPSGYTIWREECPRVATNWRNEPFRRSGSGVFGSAQAGGKGKNRHKCFPIRGGTDIRPEGRNDQEGYYLRGHRCRRHGSRYELGRCQRPRR